MFRAQQTTRLETCVDAAFAFALTMLVVSVDAVPRSYDELVEAMKRVPAFAASFLILVMFWHGHCRWSRRYGNEDTASVVLSSCLVFLVLVFLYPLRLMMAGAFSSPRHCRLSLRNLWSAATCVSPCARIRTQLID